MLIGLRLPRWKMFPQYINAGTNDNAAPKSDKYRNLSVRRKEYTQRPRPPNEQRNAIEKSPPAQDVYYSIYQGQPNRYEPKEKRANPITALPVSY
jgi:hypothetical protein